MPVPDPASLAELALEAAACAARLRLPLHNRVWRGAAGELAGGGTGSSLDFQDHRPYFPGDDPRHINWQAYARTGAYTMKLFREEVRASVEIVFDVSESMFFSPEKAARSTGLLHFACEAARRAGADLAVFAAAAAGHRRLDPAEVAALRWPAALPERPAAPPAAPDLAGLPLRPRALRLFISDLLFPGDPDALLRPLSARHGSALVFCPFAAAEAAPDWSGPCELLDVEAATSQAREIDSRLRQRLASAYQAHFSLWKARCQAFRVPLARVAAEGPLAPALAAAALPAEALVAG
jgi:uncharacterized protein (DUF58 family)